MNTDLKQQEDLLQEIEELEWNSQAIECVKKCEQYLSQYPNCRKVIPSYAHMYQYIDYKKATDIAKKLFDEDKFYFKNTYIYVYLLCEFQNRGQNDLKDINDSYINYQGEKNIYYYLALSIADQQLCNSFNYLQKALLLFEGQDKMIARVYYHLHLKTSDLSDLQMSIQLQPNFDNNYYRLAHRQDGNLDKTLEYYQKTLSINPINYATLFGIADIYTWVGSDEVLNAYNKFLQLKQYFPSRIYDYLYVRIAIEENLEPSKRQYISIDFIKEAYLFESSNSYNSQIQRMYIEFQQYFTSQDNYFDQIRDLFHFYCSHSLSDYFLVIIYESQNDFERILRDENNQNINCLLSLLAYKKYIQDEISFKSQYLVWDLFID